MTFSMRVEHGKLVRPDKPTFTAVVRGLADGDYVLSIEKPTRSSEANRYYWGVVIELLAAHCGYTPEEMHDALKIKFRSREDVGTGLTVVASTRTGSDEFWRYVETVRLWAHQDMGVYIPEPNEQAA